MLVRGDAIIVHGFAKEQDATNTRKMRWWVVPELFFVCSKLGFANFPQQMAKQHATTLKF
jgi:hypothetical protein